MAKSKPRIDEDQGGFFSIPEVSCGRCKRKHEKLTGTPTCDAFPEGIPDTIMFGGLKHTSPIAGDNGIVFDPIGG